MAITPVIPFKSTDWQSDYRAALLEYRVDGHVGFTLDRAMSGCINAMRELRLGDWNLIERRAVATALDDLFLLRHLHYKNKAVRMAENA